MLTITILFKNEMIVSRCDVISKSLINILYIIHDQFTVTSYLIDIPWYFRITYFYQLRCVFHDYTLLIYQLLHHLSFLLSYPKHLLLNLTFHISILHPLIYLFLHQPLPPTLFTYLPYSSYPTTYPPLPHTHRYYLHSLFTVPYRTTYPPCYYLPPLFSLPYQDSNHLPPVH